MTSPPGIARTSANGITGTRTKAEIRRELAGAHKTLADVPAPDELACRRLLLLLAARAGGDLRAAGLRNEKAGP